MFEILTQWITSDPIVVTINTLLVIIIALLLWNLKKALSKLNTKTETISKLEQNLYKSQLEVELRQDTNTQLELCQQRQLKQNSKITELQERLRYEQKLHMHKQQVLESTEKRLKQAFATLSRETLQENNQAFLDLAKTEIEKLQKDAQYDLEKRQRAINQIISPMQMSLKTVDDSLLQMQKDQQKAEQKLRLEIAQLSNANKDLLYETANLGKALRQPHVRGRWGELQLRRVVELAGLQNKCDFFEQPQSTGEQDLRPDMIIQLPEQRCIIVDAKTPLYAYLESLEIDDEQKFLEARTRHAALLKTHILQLSRKKYWSQWNQQQQQMPEFVILFIPGEVFFSAALESDPQLIEFAAEKKIILSTPSTLIALLKTIEMSWQQNKVTENARKIGELGGQLYDRIKIVLDHWENVGKSLNSANKAYNKASRSIESRVLSTARQLHALQTDKTDSLKQPGLLNSKDES